MSTELYKSLENQKVLISGATGFIGASLLLQLLELGCDVTCVNSSNPLNEKYKNLKVTHVTYSNSIVSIEPAFRKGTFYAIFHLAGYQALDLNSETLNTTLNSNIMFGCHLLELARQYNTEHFLYAESFFQFDEQGSYLPRNIYAASKQAFSDMLLSYSINGMKCTSLVLFDVYGPLDSRDKLFQRLDQACDSQTELFLTPGMQMHYAIYITDVVSAFCHAATIYSGDAFNRFWVFGEGRTLKSTIELWCKIKEKSLSISWGAVSYFPNQVLKPFTGKKIPGWESQVSLSEGLKKI